MKWIHENEEPLANIALDLAEIEVGVSLMTGGGPVFAGGVILDSSGVGAVIGAPANAAGVGLVVAGGGLTAHGAWELGKDVKNLRMHNESTSAGGAGSSASVGAAREVKVAEITGGKIPSGSPGSPGMRIVKPNVGSSDVDVICEVAMALGEIWWVTDLLQRGDLVEALDALLTVGLTATNPGTGARNFIDEDGRQVSCDMEVMLEKWSAGKAITAQYWISSESDVLVTADRRQNIITLDLDGLTYLEARKTVIASVGAAVTIANTRAVIVERDLPDSGEEWLSYFSMDGGELPRRPDLLLVTEGVKFQYRISVDPESWLRL